MPYHPDSIEGRFLAGEVEAVAKIVRWISSVIASTRFWALREDWLDLHQEIMGRLIASLRQERFDASQDLRSYVQGVARYTALHELSNHRRPLRALALGGHRPADPGPEDERAISRQLARQVLERATPDCQELLRAYFFEQRSYAEIAQARGVPVGTIKSRLVRCLESAHRSISGRHARRGGRAALRRAEPPL